MADRMECEDPVSDGNTQENQGGPVQVLHAFGTCPHSVRGNAFLLDETRLLYTVGSRVASVDVNATDERIGFFSIGVRVRQVHTIVCSSDKKFVAVCYHCIEHAETAYVTVYHVRSKSRTSRVKTLSYTRSIRGRVGTDDAKDKRESIPNADADPTSTGSSQSCAAAKFVAAGFSHNCRTLVALDGHPEWTLLGFEWRSGKRLYSLCIGSNVNRTIFSPMDASKLATAGDNGHFRIWRVHAGKAVSMGSVAGIREVVT